MNYDRYARADDVDHIERPSLPWRTASKTECGLSLPHRQAITREAFFERLRVNGEARTSVQTCMTCFQVCGKWETWSDSPSDVLRRELARYGRNKETDDDLRAILLLIDAHRDEFDALRDGLSRVVRLTPVEGRQ